MCKRLNQDYITKCYIRKSVQENEAPKILSDFEIQTDHLMPARREDKKPAKHVGDGAL